MPSSNAVEHLIVLMLENRSFDHMIGGLASVTPDLDGIDPGKPGTNTDGTRSYEQQDGAARVLLNDPKHEHVDVLAQLDIQNGTPTNEGFVRDYARAYPTSAPTERAEVMKYFAPDTLPATHALAQAFTVCDKWFSSLPGPTWPNRFFMHSGTSLGRVTMPEGLFDLHLHWYDQTTLYDRLNEQGVSWKIYHGDMPQSLLLVHQLEPKNLARYAKLGQFFIDLGGGAKEFPSYAFIEPDYATPGATDDHPPHDVLAGEQLIADVYNALSNSQIWDKTVLVILWDEHGGFYDHVPPPAAIPPDQHQEEFTFDRYGVRVPALIVSPQAKKAVCDDVFDHTSVLRYAIDRWHLGPLGARTAKANSIANLLDPTTKNTGPGPLFLTGGPQAAPVTIDSSKLNANQRGLVSYSQYLATITPNTDPARAQERNAFMMTSARAQLDTACDHYDRFIATTDGKQ